MSSESNPELPLEIDGSMIVKMEVSGGYYGMIGQAAEHLLQTHCTHPDGSIDMDKVKDINSQIESNNITDEWVNHYKTMLIFIYEFEKLAIQSGQLQKPEKLS